LRRTAERLDSALGEGKDIFLEGDPRETNALPEPAAPWVVGLDGVYVHAKGQRSRTEGWFEVIVGKNLPTKGRSSKFFGFVSRLRPQAQTALVQSF